LGSEVENIIIDSAGMITVKREDGTIEELGNLSISTFVNPAGLESIGRNLYIATENSGEAFDTQNDGTGGSILQGYLEYSNVQIVEEMVNLIQAQRAYEMNSKSIQTADEMLGLANNLKR
jgi:flagellar basal-body rod protein FlgG